MRRIVLFAVTAGLVAVGISAVSTPANAATVTHTKKVVVRPVHANGKPVHGYSVTRETIPDFSCDEGTSPVAVDKNIRFCGFSATYTVACWKSTGHTVLCLRDARQKKLARIRYTGSFAHVAAPAKPSPQDLILGNGGKCLIRDGGAWGTVTHHPSWVGFYSCTHHDGDVYGPPSGDGVNRAHHAWTVETVAPSGQGAVTKRKVATAYYVGTAS